MSNIIPIRPFPRADADETAVTEQVQQIPGELDLDRVIKAHVSAPAVVHRITELENSLWAVAEELLRFDPKSPVAERAKLVLKNRMEIEEGVRVASPFAPSPVDSDKQLRVASFLPERPERNEMDLFGETQPEPQNKHVQSNVEKSDDEKEDGGES